MSFADRVRALPRLGLGVSTEYGAGDAIGALDVAALRAAHPAFAGFLEIGVEISKGLDAHAAAWVAAGGATTYHFLDVNLDDEADFDDAWIAGVRSLMARLRPAWLCGDAGLWHFGRRDRGQMLLLPPILVDDAASQMAAGVARLRELLGKEVLPENPPGTAFVGDLHILAFFQRVAERADTGLLLDVAHLAMFEHVTGTGAFDVDEFDFDRVVEVHVAGGAKRDVDGFSVIDDAHGADVDGRVWELFEHVVARAKNLKAVVFECERNRNGDVVKGFERIARTWR